MTAGLRRAAVRAMVAALWLIGCGLPGSRTDRDAGIATSADRPPPRLILLVSLDTLRPDRLDVYGYGRETAPNLTALAAGGTVFSTVAAQATQTLLSHKSLFTARYPHGFLAESVGGEVDGLADGGRAMLIRTFRGVRADLLPLLQRRGYRTAAFVDRGWMRREMGFVHGFDVYDDTGGGLEQIVARFNAWLSEHQSQDQPAFVFLHAYDVHCPYVSREPYDTLYCDRHGEHLDLTGKCPKSHFSNMDLTPEDLRAISDHYDGGISSADAWMGDLLDGLRAQGVYDEALIIVTSGHSESLGERGDTGHGGLTLEQILVPLIVKWPASWGIDPARIDQPTELVDVMPTILDAAGATAPENVDGRSLLLAIAGASGDRGYLRTQIVFRSEDGGAWPASRALLDPGRVLAIYHPHNERRAAFDLSRDPRGLEDLAAIDAPHLRADLEAVKSETVASFSTFGDRAEPLGEPLDPETLEELRALGYL